MNHICVIANDYPYKGNPSFTFVKQFCNAVADCNIKVSVVAPQSLTKSLVQNIALAPKYFIDKTNNGNDVHVYRPYIITSGNFNILDINNIAFSKAIFNVISKMVIKPDVIYCYFWSNTYAAYPTAKKFNIPLFVATGESKITIHHKYSLKKLLSFVNYVKGVICVSTKNMNESINAGLTVPEKCIVALNSIDNNLFKVIDKIDCRIKLGFPLDKFIVAFVGGFSVRKGSKRVAEAINQIQDGNIYSIFVGDGTEDPICDNILHKGLVTNDDVPLYLNASDVFVLPTLHEGCCNAIVEAMACGLPIVSSDRDFNYDLLSKNYSILVDPNNIREISKGIFKLYNDTSLRNQYSQQTLKAASNLLLYRRIERILEFIRTKISS